MLSVLDPDSPGLGRLPEQPPDPLLALITLHREDPRPDKIDLGVGVYRDAQGRTPVFASIKAAEARLLREQETKGYLGGEGDQAFVRRLEPIVFGAGAADAERRVGVQTPGGTGALRLAAELIARAEPSAQVWLSAPTWPNHAPIFSAAGLECRTYPYFEAADQTLPFARMRDALQGARSGDVAVVQACCHNPTGAELDGAQWRALAALFAERGVLPVVDFAYQGLGRSLEADAAGLRQVLAEVPEALIAYSCDKNFGLYRERTGALWAIGRSSAAARRAMQNMLSLARAAWSMPPDHGAAAVRLVLEDEALEAGWRVELDAMRTRMTELRAALATAEPRLAALAGQTGMFSLLPVSPEAVTRLRVEKAIYMAGSGRINVAGLREADIARFVEALAPYLPL